MGLCVIPTETKIVPFTRQKNLKDLIELTLSSKQLQLSTEVMYLGITLDRVMEKAFRASWT
jgi:hypothetical protein